MAKFQGSAGEVQSAVAAAASQQSAAAMSATLDISSTPADADIELDGTFSGNTPSSVGVAPGEHTVKVTKKGYAPWERKVRSSSGNVRLVAELEAGAAPAPVAPPPTPAAAQVSSAPSVVKAFVAPPEAQPQIKPAVMSSTTQTRVASDAEGTVSVSSDPAGADIFVDSVGRGHAPSVVKLKPGKHHIQLVENGYKDSVAEVDVKPGEATSVVGKLEK